MNSGAELRDSTWVSVQEQIRNSSTDVCVLPLDCVDPGVMLERLGVSDQSTMGALASHAGALLVERGWLRVFAGGAGPLRSIADLNQLPGVAPPFLVVAQDVLGGRFAIDGGGLGVAGGEVCYFGPDTLEWAGIGGGYSAFLSWVLSGGLTEFYRDLRWEGWEREVDDLALSDGISFYPPLFAVEGRNPGESARRAVPIEELNDFHDDAVTQVAAIGDGERFRFRMD
jgi:hypothetical protein